MCVSSRDFREELFTEPSEYEETPLRDRKRGLPDIRHNERKAEFIRDFIALANTARLLGKPAYLLFGLTDEGDIRDISPDLKPYTRNTPHQTQEQVRQDFGHVIGKYVQPVPKYELRFGIVNSRCVAYLIINPLSVSPFRVSRDLRSGRETLLSSGECWIRFGESKEKVGTQAIAPTEAPYAYAYSEVPYVLPSLWLRYFQAILTDESISEGNSVEAHQELRAIGGSTSGANVREIVDRFVEEEGANLLILEGDAGSGKSVFLQRLVTKWAEAGHQAMEQIRRREEFSPPPPWIPIYFPLRGVNVANAEALAAQVLDQVNRWGRFWNERPQHPERLLENPELYWLICFDGLDEIGGQERQRSFITALRELTRRYARLKVILTTRPDVTVPADLGKVVRIAPLSREQVEAYLSQRLASEPQYQEVLALLEETPDLDAFCTTPLYLKYIAYAMTDAPLPDESASTGLEEEVEFPSTSPASASADSEESLAPFLGLIDPESLILDEPLDQDAPESYDSPDEPVLSEEGFAITPGWLLDRAISQIWEREARRRLHDIEKPRQWWHSTGKLALDVDGHRRKFPTTRAVQAFSGEEGLYWVLSLGFIRGTNDPGWVRFQSALVQHYFSAAFLRPLMEEDSLKGLDKEYVRSVFKMIESARSEFRREVHSILGQISNPNPKLSRRLLWPKWRLQLLRVVCLR